MTETAEINLLELIEMSLEDEQEAWALLSISPEKYLAYKEDVEAKKALDINSYGDVLAYKIGEKYPTEEEEQALTEKFGYQPNLNLEKKIAEIMEG